MILKVIYYLFKRPGVKSCLIEQLTREELKNRYPEFFVNCRENIFIINKIKDSDEIWFYRYPDIYWKLMMGEEGIVVIRGRRIVDQHVTLKN